MAAQGRATQRRLQSSEEEKRRRDEAVRHPKAKGSLPGGRKATEDCSLEKVLLELENEKLRCESLAEANSRLQEQLKKANEVNSALQEDAGKLMADQVKAQEELELKEREWHSEREDHDNKLRVERHRLLSLWCEVEAFLQHFLEMNTATDRDLSALKAEQMRLSGAILVNCSQLNTNVQPQASLTLCSPVLKDQAQQQAEQRITQKTREMLCFHELEKKELRHRVAELSALLEQSQRENKKKEKRLKTLNNTVEALTEKLYAKDNTINMLQHKLRQQGEEYSRLQQRLEQLGEGCRMLQQRLQELEEECRPSSQQQPLQALTDAQRSDCDKLRKIKEDLQPNLTKEQEACHLPRHNAELQLKEKVEQQQALEGAHRDHGLLLKDFAALEEKHSLLQREFSLVRETLEKLLLQRDQLMRDKYQLVTALVKVYCQQDAARLDLEQLLQESSGQVHSVAEVSSEQELLVLKMAALEVQLAALKQDKQGLSEQLTQARSANKILEYRLSEAQQHKSQLEIIRSQLEIQLQTVTQAKAVIQEEVKCLKWKLETERSLMQEEQQNMAEQLLKAEQKHKKVLELQETDRVVERNEFLLSLAVAEGVQQSWLLEKKLLSQQLESLQQEVARVKCASTELKEFKAELKTLEEVECQRRELMRLHHHQSLPDASGSSFSKSHQHRMPASRQAEGL